MGRAATAAAAVAGCGQGSRLGRQAGGEDSRAVEARLRDELAQVVAERVELTAELQASTSEINALVEEAGGMQHVEFCAAVAKVAAELG